MILRTHFQKPKETRRLPTVYTRRSVRTLAALWLPGAEEHPLPDRPLRVAFLRQRLTTARRRLGRFKYRQLLPAGSARYDLRHFYTFLAAALLLPAGIWAEELSPPDLPDLPAFLERLEGQAVPSAIPGEAAQAARGATPDSLADDKTQAPPSFEEIGIDLKALNLDSTEPPSRPIEEIIRRFSERESEFARELGYYAYTQTILVEELTSDGQPTGGRFERNSEVSFTPQGRRFEKVLYAPLPTLKRVSISPKDQEHLKTIQPFALTAEDIGKYDITYVGRQKMDELQTYAFKAAPRVLERGLSYFQGILWVDQEDLQIVMTYGRPVPDIRKGRREDLFAKFETRRSQVDGRYWFPAWTQADDTLAFSTGPVRIRQTVEYKDYKRRITKGRGEFEELPPAPPKPKE